MLDILKKPDTLALDQIRTDGGTQPRAGIDWSVVEEYADDIKTGDEFRAVVVYHDGENYWLADGYHRYHAHRRAKRETIAVDIRQGTRREAVLHSVGANADHGLRRTNTDKWRAAETLLVDEEWGQWSDREIARRCHVSPTFVARVRGALGSTDRPQYAPPPLPVTVHVDSEKPQERTYTTRHGTVATMKVANIGAAQELQSHVRNWLRQHNGDAAKTIEHLLDSGSPMGQFLFRRLLSFVPGGADDDQVRAALEAIRQELAAEGDPDPDDDPSPTGNVADHTIDDGEAEAMIRRALAEHDDHPEIETWAASGWSVWLGRQYGRKPLIAVCRKALVRLQSEQPAATNQQPTTTTTLTLDECIALFWQAIKEHSPTDPEQRRKVLTGRLNEPRALTVPAGRSLPRATWHAAFERVLNDLTGQIEHSRKVETRRAQFQGEKERADDEAEEGGKRLMEWTAEDWETYRLSRQEEEEADPQADMGQEFQAIRASILAAVGALASDDIPSRYRALTRCNEVELAVDYLRHALQELSTAQETMRTEER